MNDNDDQSKHRINLGKKYIAGASISASLGLPQMVTPILPSLSKKPHTMELITYAINHRVLKMTVCCAATACTSLGSLVGGIIAFPYVLCKELISSNRRHVEQLDKTEHNTILSKNTDEPFSICNSDEARIVGILFIHPESAIAKNDILPRLDYYHYRAGSTTNLFCMGYGAEWPECQFLDRKEVGVIKNEKWYFSSESFNEIRAEFEKCTTWNYSGESDLLILCTKNVKGKRILDFKKALVCQLESLINSNSIESIPKFLEEIFRLSELNSSINTELISDLHALKIAKVSILAWFLKAIKMEGVYNKSKGLAIHDVSKTKSNAILKYFRKSSKKTMV